MTTKDKEIILVPIRSTRPITYGYYKCGDVDPIIKQLESKDFKHFKLLRIEWDDSKPIGVTGVIE